MKIFKLILGFLLGFLMIIAGVNHFLTPAMYGPMIPDFFPKDLTNYGSGALEIIFGAMIFIPKFRHGGALGILALMIIFLPIHIWDATKEFPAIGSHVVAYVRIPVQLLLILWAWFISRK